MSIFGWFSDFLDANAQGRGVLCIAQASKQSEYLTTLGWLRGVRVHDKLHDCGVS